MKDYYAALGVEKTASKDEIKKAYRTLSMKYHPDRNQGDKSFEDKFKEINEAYSILSDDSKRNDYDNPDPFAGMFKGFSGFGMRRQQPQKPDLDSPRDGKLIGVEVQIPLKIFIFGGEFKVKTSYQEGCEACNGKGFTEGTECDACHGYGYAEHVERRPGFMSTSMRPCPKCQAKGQVGTDTCAVCSGNGNVVVNDKEFEFNLPPGVGIGARFGLTGVGRAGLNGGRRGDVMIMITGIKGLDLNRLSSDKMELLKSILEEAGA